MLSLFITHLQGYKRQAVRSPVFITLEVICELILPLIMAEIVDVAIPAGDTAYIFRLGAAMLALSLLSMAFGVLSAKYATFASQGFGANLRQCLFDKVQEFSFADIDRFSSASLITRTTNDVNAMTMMLNMGLRMLVRAPVMLIAALGISISINPRLAVVLLVVIPLMILAIGILMKICTRLFEVMQTKIDGLNNTLQENLVAIRVVKAFVREDHERKKFQRSNDELMMAGLNVGMKVIAIMPIMMLAMNGATVAVLYLGVLYARWQQKRPGFRAEFRTAAVGGVLFYVLLPLCLYIGSYLPYWWRDPAFSLSDWWQCQVSMFSYHATLKATHPFESRWYTWLLGLRPVWYYRNGYLPYGMKASIAGMAGPVIWLFGLAALVGLLWHQVSGRGSRQGAGVLILYGTQLIPWMLVTRCTFLYHYFPSSMFCLAALALVLARMKHVDWAKKIAAGLCVVALVLFVLYYPALSGLPIPAWWADALNALPSFGFY